MAVEDILAAIESEAAAESSRIIAEAERRASALLEEARAGAEVEIDRLARGRDEAAAVAVRRITSRAHLDAARVRREARESIYRQAKEQAAAKLGRLSPLEYRKVLSSLLTEGLAALPEAKVARVGAEDVELASDLLREIGSTAEVESGDVAGGGVVLLADGVVVHNDLPGRLERADHHLRYIAADLFPELRGG
jgi:vacuolar-type H+-ATPase subunit E/Vma4